MRGVPYLGWPSSGQTSCSGRHTAQVRHDILVEPVDSYFRVRAKRCGCKVKRGGFMSHHFSSIDIQLADSRNIVLRSMTDRLPHICTHLHRSNLSPNLTVVRPTSEPRLR